MPTLHVTNGDSAGDTLRRIVNGAVTITADPLHEGPAPAVEGDAWHDVRARFLGSAGGTNHEDIKRQLASWDRAIVDGCRAGDVVLWFEHDLFDQLLLIRTLDLLGRLEVGPAYDADTVRLKAATTDEGAVGPCAASGLSRMAPRVSMICIDSFPGVDRFVGLGQLSADQLATLVGSERRVTLEEYALASEAWAAFRSPDPRALLGIAIRLRARGSSTGTPDTIHVGALPFLGDALLRFLAEFPSVVNGLSRTEELALRALVDGPLDGGTLFVSTQKQEPRPFMGDTTFFDIISRLASARAPLVTIAARPEVPDLRSEVIAISAAGRDVLAGRRDHIALSGIDRWRGGVHLVGCETSPWRWDARGETLVS